MEFFVDDNVSREISPVVTRTSQQEVTEISSAASAAETDILDLESYNLLYKAV